MDPLMHVLLPLLFLLALRIDTRKALLLAPLTIVPDFDAAFHLHRAVFHSFVPVVILPVALILYSKMKRPEWTLSSLLVLFYLSSHVILDLDGVAFAWPFTTDMFYLDPEVTFNMQGGINFVFHLHYGIKPYVEMATTNFLSEAGFAMIFLGMLVAAVFRKEAKNALTRAWEIVKGLVPRLRG